MNAATTDMVSVTPTDCNGMDYNGFAAALENLDLSQILAGESFPQNLKMAMRRELAGGLLLRLRSDKHHGLNEVCKRSRTLASSGDICQDLLHLSYEQSSGVGKHPQMVNPSKSNPGFGQTNMVATNTHLTLPRNTRQSSTVIVGACWNLGRYC